jgi:hypothetical protein
MMTMKASYETAAIKAAETLIKYRIATAPIEPMPILKKIPGVIVLSFAEMSETIGIDRTSLLGTLVTENHDAVTAVNEVKGKLVYCVAYNQRLPFYLLQRALSRELGHIVLGHDGSKPEEVRTEEAKYFAKHLICPRPLIRSIQEAGVPITVELFGNITGCYERCMKGIRITPGANVPAELNRLVREQFADYVSNLLDYHTIFAGEDTTGTVDFGTFMDGYAD